MTAPKPASPPEKAPVPTPPRVTLVLGGARSGKSRHAEGLVARLPSPWLYVATAEAFDDEMRKRIDEHRRRRDGRWRTIEAPRELAQVIRAEAGRGAPMLVDCLTLWLSNVMLAGADVERACGELLAALGDTAGPVVLVSNEVGWGIVPETALARAFRDAQGVLNSRVAEIAGHVVLVAAGLPLALKS